MATISLYRGAQIRTLIDELARLRLTVFREWPYLYAGTFAEEREYLSTYARCPQSLAVVALDGDAIVGASTALPLADAHAEFSGPFRQAGEGVDVYFYLGESVLQHEYRGQGIGKRLMAERLAEGRQQGFSRAAFCAVDRDPADPRRPADYRPLATFWQRYGFTRQPHLQARFRWPEVDGEGEPEHQLTFWTASL
ncbi:MAG: GNAT family N-acetyltransferase [Opitutales bacterium]